MDDNLVLDFHVDFHKHLDLHFDFYLVLDVDFNVDLKLNEFLLFVIHVVHDNDALAMDREAQMASSGFWDGIWSRKYERYNRHHREIWEAVLPFMDGSVVDLGIGAGVLYENTGIDLTGLDQSIEGLKQAQKHYPGGKYVLGNAAKTPFLDKSFDTCMMLGLLDYHKRIDGFVDEARRITRKRIIATVMNGWQGHDWSNPPFPCIARVGTWMVLDIPVCAP